MSKIKELHFVAIHTAKRSTHIQLNPVSYLVPKPHEPSQDTFMELKYSAIDWSNAMMELF